MSLFERAAENGEITVAVVELTAKLGQLQLSRPQLTPETIDQILLTAGQVRPCPQLLWQMSAV
jgi:hypothetical protein